MAKPVISNDVGQRKVAQALEVSESFSLEQNVKIAYSNRVLTGEEAALLKKQANEKTVTPEAIRIVNEGSQFIAQRVKMLQSITGAKANIQPVLKPCPAGIRCFAPPPPSLTKQMPSTSTLKPKLEGQLAEARESLKLSDELNSLFIGMLQDTKQATPTHR